MQLFVIIHFVINSADNSLIRGEKNGINNLNF